jgi:hypothetical protein
VSLFSFLFWLVERRKGFSFRRSTSVRAVQRLVQHLAGTRSVPSSSFCNTFFLLPLWWQQHLIMRLPSFLRALGGAVNLVVTLGNNMYAGAHARSTFPTRRPSHKVSTSPHHDNEQASLGLAGLSPPERKANRSRVRTYAQGGKKMLHFHFCCVVPWGERETLRGRTVYKKGGGEKVIINHIYDAVREPT